MQIKTLEVAGFHSALKAMRNPLDSWAKSDSSTGRVGRKDMGLSDRLAQAGPEHAKHLRMIMVYADITAPRYWWTEMDTYRIGVEKVSCSTMHTLMRRELTIDDFEHNGSTETLQKTVNIINGMMVMYRTVNDPETKKSIWYEIIRILPQSFLQTRTCMFSYQALRNIYRQREGHKLNEWHVFRIWIELLPESWMITGKLPEMLSDEME